MTIMNLIQRKSIIIAQTFVCLILEINAGADHKKLLTDLLSDYNIEERPVQNDNDTVLVDFGLSIISLLDLNMARNYLEANVWLHVKWNDINMRWNSSNYGGIDHVTIPPHRIWKPDIHLYNSIHHHFDNSYQTGAIVKYDGNITYIPPAILQSTCTTNVKYYPFDEHECTLKFGSWTWNGNKINLSMESEGADLSDFTKNTDWEILAAPGKVHSTIYECCPEPYVNVAFVLQMKRRGSGIFSGQIFALLLGTVAIFLSLLLPPNSAHRINLGVVTMVALIIMANSIFNILSKKPALIVCYFRTLALLSLVSIVANVFIMQFHNQNPLVHKVPDKIRDIFFERLPDLLWLSRHQQVGTQRLGSISSPSDREPGELFTDLQVLLQRVSGQETKPTNDWQYLAIVLDRLALIVHICLFSVFFLAFACHFA